jgi:predicted permease
MSIKSRTTSLLKNLFRRGRIEQELDDELRSYIETLAEEKRRRGFTDSDARRAALVDLGGIEPVKEAVRDGRAGALIEAFRRDVGYAMRLLAKNRGFAAIAAATIALGVGANTAIFTVVDTVVFRPLPYRDPEQLVRIWGRTAGQPDDVSWADFADVREQNDVFEQMAADDGMGFDLTTADGSREAINGAFVTPDWLTTLGVQPMLGRNFVPSEGEPGRDRVVILSYAYWQRRFGADPHVLGSTLVIDKSPFTVIGVAPPNVLRYGSDFLKPLVAAEYPHQRSHRDLDVFARVKPGVTLSQAQSALDAIARRLEEAHPTTNKGRSFRVVPLGKSYASIEGGAGRGLLLMLGAVGLVLLIACANVTNLLLARALARSRECVIRAALGASRARLVRQMLVETVLLFLLGGVLGLLLADWLVEPLVAFAVAGGYVPERMAIAIDGRILAFALTLSLFAGVLAGLVPALQASRVNLNDSLRASSQTIGGFRRTGTSRLLIVGEIAISIVLLVGSGLLMRSFLQLQARSGGVVVENLLLTASDGGRSFPAAVTYWRAALERAREFPGVAFAAVTSRPPVHGARSHAFTVDVADISAAAGDARAGDILISPDYFRTMGIPLLKGRLFTDADSGGAPPVAIVSQRLAERLFPNGAAIGRRVKIQERSPMSCCTAATPVENVWREIVGVVADVRQGNLDEDPAMTIYRPYSQIVEHDMYLMVRASSRVDATRIASGLRQHLLAMDPAKVWAEVRPMRDVIAGSESLRLRRFVLTLLAAFAALALFLAAVGTYGVMAYAISERTKEIGIRVALGATRSAILREVMAEAARLTFAGLVVGALAAQLLTRFISALLFGVTSTDGLTYFGATIILAASGLVASYVPARRALRVDPLIALRHDG